jgi:hypothetical protein
MATTRLAPVIIKKTDINISLRYAQSKHDHILIELIKTDRSVSLAHAP